MFGRSVCQLRAEQMTHTTCFSCVFIRRVSQLTNPPSSSRNFVQFLCQPVPALDDQVRTLQQDLRTQPSLQRRRFSCVPLRAHRGFLSSTRGGSVVRRDARMRMPLETSRRLCAKKKQSSCQYGSELGSTN